MIEDEVERYRSANALSDIGRKDRERTSAPSHEDNEQQQ
jgi:hypothetical protein